MIHGTAYAYRNQGCRCEACTRASTRRQKQYRVITRADKDGSPTIPLRVDAEPVRHHIRSLRGSGWRMVDIAREVGVSRNHLAFFVSAARRPQRVNRDFAARILELRPLTPVDLDEVVVERLVAGADWRTVGATRAERIAAAAHMSGNEAEARLGLRPGRDYEPTRRSA